MLELKTKHTERQGGIYAPSVPATRKDIELAEEMVQYVDDQAEQWANEYGLKGWAIAHAQLTDDMHPKRIFVVHKDLIGDELDQKNAGFPSRMVFNPVLLEANTHLETVKMVRKTVVNEKTGKRERPQEVPEVQKTSNVIPMQEGCMSFPLRKPKKIDRIFQVKVRYWYPVEFLGFKFLWRKTEVVEGLKAQIFQHEIQHFEAENIYHKKEDVPENFVFDTKVMA